MRTSAKRIPRSALLTAALAAVVTVAALVVIVVLRPEREGTPVSAGVPAPASGQANETCGAQPCRQLAAVTVGEVPVVLFADASGGRGRVQVGTRPPTEFELAISGMGAKLTASSLQCVDGSTAACLVRGRTSGGAFGELLTGAGGVWRDFGKPYFADTGTLSLSDVSQDGRPDVIVVRHECPRATPGTASCQAAPVLAEVYELAGDLMGCTATVTSPSDLRGWPDVQLRRSQLRPCPDAS
ncbi:hypothetical protein [Amycolatopsis jiangsuensis]|uniref:VCBS repeat-containing protein n=1 Tax=Amycolatopsis jiangsuensis TaxID=1181879 RepID=A0A840IY30_9PSEU|nr:hypothetical protein [Amycolatopsis jiangsuensis]MBB4686197.1 hypothetical protein [Amycolatopsis jiangsuensis]